jgi:hypothetical protein
VGRTGLIGAALVAILLVAGTANASAATRVTCPGMSTADSATTGATVSKPDFLVHYATAAISAAQANQLGDDAEAGRGLELGTLGYPAPMSDTGVTTPPGVSNPDGRTDVYVFPDGPCPGLFATTCACNGFTTPDNNGGASTASGWIYVNPAVVGNKSTVAHEFFHTVQMGIAEQALNAAGPDMLTEGSATWIGALAANGDGGHLPQYLRNSRGATLDCARGCAPGADAVYAQWPFFELEQERVGPLFVKGAFTQALGNPPPGGNQLTWMNAALGGGGALGNAVADYAATVGAADFASPLLAGRFPTPTFETIANIGAGQSATQTTTVDHLAARFYGFTATATTTLHLDWSWPAGSDVRAALAREGSPTGTRIPVSANATGAHADVAVSAGTTLVASFANPSMTANGVPVSVTARTDAAPSSGGGGAVTAPRQATPTTGGPVVTVVPSIALAGKPKVSRSGSSRVLTFTVNSSGAGFLVATLSSGKAKLARPAAVKKATSTSRTFSLQAGVNKLRYKLSRRVAKGRYSVTLTPQSSNFSAGTPVSAGTVSVPKPKPKPVRHRKRARYYL